MSRSPYRRPLGLRWLHRLDLAGRLAAGWMVFVLPSVVWAAGTGPTNPDALGSLIAAPPGMVPDQGMTLFENVPMERYVVWTDLGIGDVVENAASVIYAPLQQIAMVLVRLAITLSWWLERLTSAAGIADTVGQLVQTSATAFNSWLLPSALALGAGIAYVQARRGESAISQLITVLAIGTLAVGLSLSGVKVVQGMDAGRGLLATTIGNATGSVLTTTDAPLPWPANYSGGTPQTQLARKSGDTIWRVFAVAPWCEAQFGSLDACQRYGAQWLTLTNDGDRKDFVNKTMTRAEGGSGDAATVRFMQGHYPSMRITVSLFSTLLGGGAALAVGGIAFVALMAWVIALLLLGLAGFFLAIMVIPGRPRQIGADYIGTVIGGTIFSALAGGLLWSMLAVSSAAAAAATPLGYLPMAILGLSVLLAGWKTKSILEGMLYGGTSMRSQGDRGLSMTGFMAARLGMRGPRRLAGASASAIGRATGLGGRTGSAGRAASGQPGSTGGHGPSGGGPTRSRTLSGGGSRFASLRPQGRTDEQAPRDQRPEPVRPAQTGTRAGGQTAARPGTGRSMDGPRYNIQRRRAGNPPASRITRPSQPQDRTQDRAQPRIKPTAAGATPRNAPPVAPGGQPRRRFVELTPHPERAGRPADRFGRGPGPSERPR